MTHRKNGNNNHTDPMEHCSFCGAARNDAKTLFSGADGAHICTDCLERGHQMLAEMQRTERARLPFSREELWKPARMKAFLDDYVIGLQPLQAAAPQGRADPKGAPRRGGRPERGGD